MTGVTGNGLFDVLKQKMLESKEELEKWKVEVELMSKKKHELISLRDEAEGLVASISRKIRLVELDLDRTDERLNLANNNLATATQSAEESERLVKSLENKNDQEDSKLDELEKQVIKAKVLAEEADKKYGETARKLALLETDLERAEERVIAGESKIIVLEEEVKVASNNLKSLEALEFQSCKSEESFADQLKDLTSHYKEAEARAEIAERAVQRLQKEVDRMEDKLMEAKDENKKLDDALEAALRDIQNL